jgi:hypothetical protein
LARYSVGVVGAAPAAAGPLMQFKAGANECRLLELWMIGENAAGSTYDIHASRPATLGTASTSTVGLPEDPAEAAPLGAVQTAWSANPTIGTKVRNWCNGSWQGDSVNWLWRPEGGFVIPVNGAFLIWNATAAAGPACISTWVWEE